MSEQQDHRAQHLGEEIALCIRQQQHVQPERDRERGDVLAVGGDVAHGRAEPPRERAIVVGGEQRLQEVRLQPRAGDANGAWCKMRARAVGRTGARLEQLRRGAHEWQCEARVCRVRHEQREQVVAERTQLRRHDGR